MTPVTPATPKLSSSTPTSLTPSAPKPPVAQPPPRTTPVVMGTDRKEPIKGIQKAMKETMTIANGIPHFGYNDEIDVSALVAIKPDLQKIAAQRGVKFSFTPLFIKVS